MKNKNEKQSWFRAHPVLTTILVIFALSAFISLFTPDKEKIVEVEVEKIVEVEIEKIVEVPVEEIQILTSFIEEESDALTIGEKNALSKALSYLDYSAFSREGLIEQLEYEGYSHEEAVYGVNNCEADWNKQAALKAQSYLDYSAFSREGLIEQLEYEGFTNEQAEYGVEAVGY